MENVDERLKTDIVLAEREDWHKISSLSHRQLDEAHAALQSEVCCPWSRAEGLGCSSNDDSEA